MADESDPSHLMMFYFTEFNEAVEGTEWVSIVEKEMVEL